MRFCDSFCGLGGWGFALRALGAEPGWAADFDRARLRLHAANHPKTKCVRVDFCDERATRRRLAKERACQIAVVSSPCQGFSTRKVENSGRALF